MARPRTQARGTMVRSRDRATSSLASRRAVLKRIKDEGVEHVLFWFTDLEGHLKSFAITPAEMQEALNDGMGFDGSSITGFNAIEESDMVAIPDPATFQLMPRPIDDHGHAIGSNVARMICDVVTPDGSPYEGDPRFALRKALERMEGMGFDAFNVGPELEYFLFEDDRGTQTIDEGGYFAMTVQDAATEVRNDTIAALEAVGIPIEYHHHEVGPSQHEIDMRYADALAMADHTITYRLIVKEVATWHGYYATFMPKPSSARTARGCTRTCPSSRVAGTSSSTGATSTTSRRPRRRSSRASSCTRARCRRCSLSGSTRTSASCPVTRRPSTSPGRSATARRSSGSPCTSPAPSSRPGPRSAAPTRRATRTSRSPRCCTRASRASSRATSSRSRWSGTSTASPPRSGRSRG